MGTWQKAVYLTAMDKAEQDLKDTLSIADVVLTKFREDCPQIKNVYIKTDNAGCYHANSSVELMNSILKKHGINLIRYDYNEPQRGKDVCDREAAYVKTRYRNYLDRDSQNKISNAKQLLDAIMADGGPKQAKGVVISIDKSQTVIKNNQKIPNIKNYHSYVPVGNNSMKYFEYFEIGTGKIIECGEVEIDFSITMETDWIFSHRQNIEMSFGPSKDKFMCSEPKCRAMFSTIDDLLCHENSNFHDYGNLVSSMDKVRNVYMSKNYIQQLPSSRIVAESVNLSDTDANLFIQQYEFGWARPVRNLSRFSEKQKLFIQKLFEIGEKTKKKLSPDQMANRMKTEKLENGKYILF